MKLQIQFQLWFNGLKERKILKTTGQDSQRFLKVAIDSFIPIGLLMKISYPSTRKGGKIWSVQVKYIGADNELMSRSWTTLRTFVSQLFSHLGHSRKWKKEDERKREKIALSTELFPFLFFFYSFFFHWKLITSGSMVAPLPVRSPHLEHRTASFENGWGHSAAFDGGWKSTEFQVCC